MRRLLAKSAGTRLTILGAVALCACGGTEGDGTNAEPAVEVSDGQVEAASPTPPTSPSAAAGAEDLSVDLGTVPWALDLHVNLENMDRQTSGLYIQVVSEGRGVPAVLGDSLFVHYTVWLPNGQKLDSSFDHDPPEPLPMALGVTELIAGWTEGVTGMRVGERRRLAVPHDLAYGPAGRTGVPPYSPLLFELQLAGLRKAQ